MSELISEMIQKVKKISFKGILNRILLQEISFKQLLDISDRKRVSRSQAVSRKSMSVKSIKEGEKWAFSYKSNYPHSTTGDRFQGYVILLKEDVTPDDSAIDLDCRVHCTCPDYFYRWEYNNYKAGAGDLLKPHNGKPPRSRDDIPPGVGDLGEGLCKHLIALGKDLQTKIEPTAPQPEDTPEPITPSYEQSEEKLFRKINRVLSYYGLPVLDDKNQLKDFNSKVGIYNVRELQKLTQQKNDYIKSNNDAKIAAIDIKINKKIQEIENKIKSIKTVIPSKKPLTINAPEPEKPEEPKTTTDTSYSDTRSGGGITENMNELCSRLDDFVSKNPQFEVTYED